MSDQGQKLFLVEGKYSNTFASRMANFGDDYSERYPFTEVAVAKSPDEAIERVWSRMEKRCNEHREKAKKVLAEVKALEEKGDNIEAAKRLNRATGFLGEISPIPPSVPQDREKWRASEIKVEGYHIQVEPEA